MPNEVDVGEAQSSPLERRLPQAGIFESLARTAQDFWTDLTEHTLKHRRSKGTVTPATGVTKPVAQGEVRTMEDILATVNSWKKDQKERRGGFAYDTAGSPVNEGYRARRYKFIAESEGVRTRAYDDATGLPISGESRKQGLVTVGVGFNMERPDARDVWFKATGRSDKEFDEVYAGKRRVTQDEARKLFDHTAQEAESIIQTKFKDTDLQEHQRLALVSLAFNNPALVGPNLTGYVKSGNFRAARDEILHKSNAKKVRGLAVRRYKEASMFVGGVDASSALPGYKDYMKDFT